MHLAHAWCCCTPTDLFPQVVHHAHDARELLVLLLVLLPVALLLGGRRLLWGGHPGHVGHGEVSPARTQIGTDTSSSAVRGLCLLLLSRC